ncbi:sigma-70 family RNA polymerase sigma factor [Clostridium paraputrificum]|uniref:sigma-70 family RNA polymerase sigma factor n=1 Tax=Clostridium paraputrificum TaxID=29363 RepID=UPI003D35572F
MKINEMNFIEQIKKKNPRAMDYIIDNYLGIIQSISKKHLSNLSSVQDECVNDVLLSIWRNIDSYDSTRSELRNWIAGITKFKAIDYKRKYLKGICYENIDDLNIAIDDKCAENIINDDLRKDLDELLSCLKEKDRELFIKLYVEDRMMDEVSIMTGIQKNVIYNRVSRGKKKIRSNFKLVEGTGEKEWIKSFSK